MSKRKNKPLTIAPVEVICREAIEELTLKQANEVFRNQSVKKFFPEVKKNFYGIVKKVEKDLPDADGNIEHGFQFLLE
jgi:hypothetical protein